LESGVYQRARRGPVALLTAPHEQAVINGMKWLILILAIVANALASVMVKMAVIPPRKFPSLTEPFAAIGNWPLWLGLAFYGVAFLLYAASLTNLPLNVAYPVLTSGAVAIVALLSVLVFNEQLYWTTVAGLVLVVVGVALTVSRVS
jgi:small multidrug resistance pump